MKWTLSELFTRKHRAQSLLDDEMLVECWAVARVHLLREFETSKTPEARELVFLQLQALKQIHTRLRAIIADYDVAQSRRPYDASHE